jgi:hypothetical protein
MNTLQPGDRGERVRELQLLLLCTGAANPGAPDGIFGERTGAAVWKASIALGGTGELAADGELLEQLRSLPRVRTAIPRVRTPASVEDLLGALGHAYEIVFNRPVNALAVRVAAAQLQLEHGVDLAAIWVYNLGNLDAVRPYQGPYFYLTAPEVIAGREVRQTKALRAYTTLVEGAFGYWRRLVEGHTGALWAFERGDPARAAELLKALRYFTGDVEAYRRAMVDRFRALGGVG